MLKRMSSEEVVLTAEDLCVKFKSGQDYIQAVRHVNFEMFKGKTLGLVGESGSGKSVTTKSLLRLHDHKTTRIEGNVHFEGKNILSLPSKKMSEIRGSRISMIFQDPMTSLNPLLKVGDQVAEVIIRHQHIGKKEAKEKVIKLLESVGINSPRQRYHQNPYELSGGMQQRIMIAIALACEPTILLADEPTTALDVTIQAEIINLMKRMQKKSDMAILMITHDLGVVANICDYVAVMYAGQIVEYADVNTIFKDPKHPYTKGLISAMPTLGRSRKRLEVIEGQPPRLTGGEITSCAFAERCKSVMDVCRSVPPLSTGQGSGHSVCCHLYPEKEVALDGN